MAIFGRGTGWRPRTEVLPKQAWGPISMLGLLLLALIVACVYVLFEIWPAMRAPESAGSTKIEFFGDDPSVRLSPDGALLALALLAGALGSLLHAAISLGDYAGNRRFKVSWIWWYLVRAPAGALLAFIFYVAIRGGFLTTNQSSDGVNEYGIAAVSALAGLFAKNALDKLEEVFRVLFGSRDEQRADGLANPVPVIAEIEPPSFPKESKVTLVIRGSGFTEGSQVRVAYPKEREWRVIEGALVSVSPDQLEVAVGDTILTQSGPLYVTVVNPEPGGGVSGPYPVDVT
jgi:IPT/TIG domain